ncbi:dihydrofolate synthase [Nakamurella sp. YIM 132087]|uniref:Dihydrofolate synthase/folylpolyglutamate synthase n=1 Tax=Nakamurella alba TaxID=2665158 RepID=A0A7K1FJU4_9ACTN|nr:dihydrofolate synthase [Nakamurella alba]
MSDGELDGVDEAEVLAATADLDDSGDALLIPDSAPLTLAAVEAQLDRRRNEVQISPTLDRITALMDLLGNPQQAYPVLQIAGTNGKTSVARMIDALLTRLGVRTGRFTSPHLQVVTERISLDGTPIDVQRYVEGYADVAPYVDLVDAASAKDGGIPLSKFEILTAMAYSVFADAPVDAAVIEVGLGGTWDSTSVADPRISVITPIGIDHTEFLGEDLPSIAGNKAGIIKRDSVAVIGRQDPAAMEVLLRRSIEVDAAVARFGAEFTVLERSFAVGGQRLTLQGLGGVYEDVFLPLSGEHQAENAALALAAVEAFFGAGAGRQLDLAAVQDGFAAVSSPGRLERVRTSPTIIVDAAHNPAGASALAAALAAEFSFRRLVGVIAVMGDKDVRGVLTALADSFDEVVVTVNSSPRSLPVPDLTEIAVDVFGEERVHSAERMDEAIALAVDLAESGDDEQVAAGTGVVVTGSVVSAGDGRALAGLAPS